VPADVLAECRRQAARWLSNQRPRPGTAAVALIVVLIFVSWLTVLWLAWRWAESWLAY
jgi:hypothetical protein